MHTKKSILKNAPFIINLLSFFTIFPLLFLLLERYKLSQSDNINKFLNVSVVIYININIELRISVNKVHFLIDF